MCFSPSKPWTRDPAAVPRLAPRPSRHARWWPARTDGSPCDVRDGHQVRHRRRDRPAGGQRRWRRGQQGPSGVFLGVRHLLWFGQLHSIQSARLLPVAGGGVAEGPLQCVHGRLRPRAVVLLPAVLLCARSCHVRCRPTQPCTARLLVHTPATTSIGRACAAAGPRSSARRASTSGSASPSTGRISFRTS